MKALISEELEQLIDEKILLDLEVGVLTKKIEKVTLSGDLSSLSQLKTLLDKKFAQLKRVNDQLRGENVRIAQPFGDDTFIQYNFYKKFDDGGLTEGNLRYWKEVVKYRLRQRFDGLLLN
jgi:hypothetical protein